MKKLLLGCLATISFFACKNDKTTPSVSSGTIRDAVSPNVNDSINPADDFFTFANGGWLNRNPIPASESNWGIGKLLQEDIYNKMRKVSEAAANNTSAVAGSNEQKIGDFWRMGMDTLGIEKQGIMPLKAELDQINAIKDINGVLEMVANLQTYQVGPLYGGFIYQDLKNSSKYSFYLWQGGLGLPDRDYYFNTDERNSNIRSEYKKHLANLFKLMGDKDWQAEERSETVFQMERFLAQSQRKIEELRDQYKNYNPMSIKDLQNLTPSVSWKMQFEKMGITTDSVVVGQPEFLRALDASLTKFPIEDWKLYLKSQLVGSFADNLSKAFEDEHFNFNGKILEGKKELKPRWKRVLDVQEAALGDALGQLFVKEFFPETAKLRYSNMVESIKEAYAENINALDWMSAETKVKALDKLKRVSKKVGYPDKWKDFSSMTIDTSSYVRNIINANKWWHHYNASKLGKPVDRNEWDMTPQTYNAYYNPSNNEIVLPAAIFMVPGFSDSELDDAVAYGYAGASTIGHEITHGFDDQGRQYDAAGNLVAWWTPADSTKFTERANMLVAQFNEFLAVDTMHVRGEATLGENIADLGGIVLGLKAFMKTEQYKKGEKIGGYTPTQRYFMGYALGWMSQQRKERLARQIMTDVHSPANLRVNGPFANIPEFYEAFNVQPTNKMWRDPAKRVKIW
jgi:putative endopeptidase